MRHDLALRIGTIIDRLDPSFAILLIITAEKADESAAAERVARPVDGDARQPGLEFRSPLKLLQMGIGLNESVLRDRVGFDLFAHDRICDAVDLALKAVHQNAECAAVTAECSGDQFAIGRVGCVDLCHANANDTSHRTLDASSVSRVYMIR